LPRYRVEPLAILVLRVALDHLDNCSRGHNVSIGSKADYDCSGDFRDIGVVIVLFAPVNVGNMKFHNRFGEHLEGFENGDWCKRVGGWIDDDAAAKVNGLGDPIDQLRFTVRLSKLDCQMPGCVSASRFDSASVTLPWMSGSRRPRRFRLGPIKT